MTQKTLVEFSINQFTRNRTNSTFFGINFVRTDTAMKRSGSFDIGGQIEIEYFIGVILNRPQGSRVVIQHHFIIGDCGKGMAHAAGSDAFAQKGRFSSLDQGCTEREENKKKEETGV